MRVAAHEWTPRRIRELRLQFGETQSDFARRLAARRGKPVQANRVARWERGSARPSLEYVALLRDLEREAYEEERAAWAEGVPPPGARPWIQRRFGVGAPEERREPSLAWDAILDLALAEDIGGGDVTTEATVAPDAWARGTVVAKGTGVVSGLEAAAAVFARVDPAVRFAPRMRDGDRVAPGATIARVEGPARGLLTGERVALNLLQRLSGVATLTARFVETVAGTGVRVVDTRKTTPGLRTLEKAAVRHGGGHNHRFGLADGVLIKDNHLAAVGGPDRVATAVRLARARAPHTLRIEVEVTTLDELAQALDAGADVVLLDNMDVATMRRAVELTSGRALLEASGGVSLQTVRAIAETGVDLVSVGALTHSAPALDISLDFALDLPGTEPA